MKEGKNYELWLDGADSWIHPSDKEPDEELVFSKFLDAKRALNSIFYANIEHYKRAKYNLSRLKQSDIHP